MSPARLSAATLATRIRELAPAGSWRVTVYPFRPMSAPDTTYIATVHHRGGDVLPIEPEASEQLADLLRAAFCRQPDLDWSRPVNHRVGSLVAVNSLSRRTAVSV